MIRTLQIGIALFSIGLVEFSAPNGWAQNQYRGLNAQRCAVVDCNGGGGGPSGGPPAPSQDDLRRAKDAKDLDEAAQDAEDKAIAAARRNDYAAAVRYLKEALSYNPDDDHVKQNLQRAEQRLAETEAARQLKTTEHHSTTAVPLNDDPASAAARKGFDEGGVSAGTIAVPESPASAVQRGDPVVPESQRTPQITAMESERGDLRKNIATFETERSKLDPKTDAVKISEIKQKQSDAESKVHYLNFSIKTALTK